MWDLGCKELLERLPKNYHQEILRRWERLSGARIGLWGG